MVPSRVRRAAGGIHPRFLGGGARRGYGRSVVVAASARKRARGDVVRLVHRNLGVQDFSRTVTRILGRAVPFDGICLLTIDPATLLPTGEIAEGGLPAAAMIRLTEIELREPDFNKFTALARAHQPAASLVGATAGDLDPPAAGPAAGRARAAADGADCGGPAARLARARIRTPAGRWVVVRGSLLGDGPGSRVAVLLEAARPPELAPLIADAYGFTERERLVTELVAQGFPTSEIAGRLHLSAYTVQDHLKSIFEKSGTGSRGDLVARLFFGHYAPRLTPHGTTSVPTPE